MKATTSLHVQTSLGDWGGVSEPSTPKDETTMKSVLERDFVKNLDHDIVTVATSVHKPSPSKDRHELLVKIAACSLSSIDAPNLGKRKRDDIAFQLMDVCGIVEEASEAVENVKVGDMVVATDSCFPVEGISEFIVVNAVNAAVIPPTVDAVEAAGCSDAVAALNMMDYIHIGDRLLVLGGETSVGSSAIELALIAGASYVAATCKREDSSSPGLSKASKIVVDDGSQKWWEEFCNEKFDKVIDVTAETSSTEKARHVLKSSSRGGMLIALINDEKAKMSIPAWYTQMTSYARLPALVQEDHATAPPTSNLSYVPVYPFTNIEGLSRILKLVQEKKLSIMLDPRSPLPFSEEGVQTAFQIQSSGHPHGRVVVKIEG